MNFYMYRITAVAYALLGFAVSIFAQGYSRDERIAQLKANPMMASNQMSVYRCDTLTPHAPAPKGYEAFYISHYGRHGSRISTNGYAKRMNYCDSILNIAHQRGLLSEQGEEFRVKFNNIIRQCTGRYEYLTQVGVQQHQGIARRMYSNYPALFSKGARVHCLSSTSQRCIMSMSAFTGKLTSIAPQINISYECAPRYQYIINIRGSEEAETQHYKAKRSYDYKNANLGLFKDSAAEQEMVKDKKTFIKAMLQAAIVAQNLESPEYLFDYIPFEELLYQWENTNLSFYSATCITPENSDNRMKAAKPAIEFITSGIDRAVASGSYAADLKFGHDFPLIVYMSILGLECVPQGLSQDEVTKYFNLYDISSMASNIQLVFYHSKKASQPVLVKVLHNEKEAKLTGLTPVNGPYYKWEDLKTAMLGRVGN